jgi:hypothetical protein
LKFFFKNNPKLIQYRTPYQNTQHLYDKASDTGRLNLQNFCNIFHSRGSLVSKKHTLSTVFTNLNLFMYSATQKTITNNYVDTSWLLGDAIIKRLSSVFIFESTLSLIKPPFVVKSILVPKKLRKKSKKKYLVKIVYKSNNKRVKSALRQLCHYSNKFNDGNFNVRLYKSILFSFLERKNSYLFKLKTTIFKNFFKN